MAPKGSFQFSFPAKHHLSVVTERNVLAWNATGIRKTFTSGSNGILAAKETRNGSGTLAVSDSHVVFLHQVEQGMGKSYRLKGADGQIRLLQFSPDSDILFFSTSLLNSVQSYSLREARLLGPGSSHPTPPTALAVSPTSHLIISASDNPPNIYLQSLTNLGAPVLLNPMASTTAAIGIVFHPTRPNTFLIAFKDGTLAAYDATRVVRMSGRTVSGGYTKHAGADSDSEIGSFKSLHPVCSSACRVGTDRAGPGGKSTSITGALFLPNSRCRALSVGSDGKCNIVDFERSRIVKTWHIKAPATSVSILHQDQNIAARTTSNPQKVSRTKPAAINSTPDVAQTIVAIGRVDGKVVLYDTFGNLLAQKTVDEQAGRVIDVEWVPGPGPQSLGDWSKVELNDGTTVDLNLAAGKYSKTQVEASKGVASVDIVANLETPSSGIQKVDKSTKRATEPAEVSERDGRESPTEHYISTVKHNNVGGHVNLGFPNPSANTYMDLFSPVKRRSSAQKHRSPIRRTPSKLRPRLSSSTFVKHSDSNDSPPLTRARLTGPFPYETPVEGIPTISTMRFPQVKAPRKVPSPKRKVSAKKINVKDRDRVGSILNIPTSLLASQKGRLSPASLSSGKSSANSKILSDIRQLTGTLKHDKGRKFGVNLALLAPYYNPAIPHGRGHLSSNGDISVSPKQKRATIGKRTARLSTSGAVAKPGSGRVRLRPRAKATAAEDLWLSAESELEQFPQDKPKEKTRSEGIKGCNDQPRQVGKFRGEPNTEALYTQPSEFAEIPSSLYTTTSASSSSISTLSPTSCRTRPVHVINYPHAHKGPAVHIRENNITASSTSIVNSHSTESIPSSLRSTTDSDTVIVGRGNENGQLFSAQDRRLPPGFAQSYQGPVDVEHYLPRRASLGFLSPESESRSPVSSGRRALGEISGNGIHHEETLMSGALHYTSSREGNLNEKMTECHGRPGDQDQSDCPCCLQLKDEVDSLRREVAQLRKLVKGKEGIAPDIGVGPYNEDS